MSESTESFTVLMKQVLLEGLVGLLKFLCILLSFNLVFETFFEMKPFYGWDGGRGDWRRFLPIAAVIALYIFLRIVLWPHIGKVAGALCAMLALPLAGLAVRILLGPLFSAPPLPSIPDIINAIKSFLNFLNHGWLLVLGAGFFYGILVTFVPRFQDWAIFGEDHIHRKSFWDPGGD